MSDEVKDVMTVEEAAAFLRMAESTLRDRVAKRRRPMVPHFRIGGRIRFRRSTLEAWLNELEAEARKGAA